MTKITFSVIKADIGSVAGHVRPHQDLIDICKSELEKAKKSNVIEDYFVTHCGDDIQLIMTHRKGVDSEEIHKLAWDTFIAGTARAKELKLYGAGQDLLVDAFSGNVKGMGPGVAEMEFEERGAEPVIVLAADKTDPGAYSLPVFRMFADPFCTPGLVLDPKMTGGFTFEVHDVKEGKKIMLSTPEEMHDLLAFIGSTSRYLIKRVYRKSDNEIVAALSTDKLAQIAGKYVGKDDPVAVVRAQNGFPSVGEIIEPFAFPHLVSGWMRGSHKGPLMPVGLDNSRVSRLDGPPRVIALGFQVNNGQLVGPEDLFSDVAYDLTREKAQEIADYMRRHGPFEPHRLPEEELEYTALKGMIEKLSERFEKI